VRGDGLLAVDSNDNLLRDRFCGPVVHISDGMMTPGGDPGLGIEPDLSSIATCRTV
jgi:D-galactarolactone cycloisomerase